MVTYNRGDGILEIIIRDITGTKIDHFKVNLKDGKTQTKIFAMIRSKYGINLEEAFDESNIFEF